MSEIKLQGLLPLILNRAGHPVARAITKGLWQTKWVRQAADRHPELMRLFSEGAIALTSLLEVGGDHPVARFANYLAETVATENLELLEQHKANPNDPETAKKVEEKAEAAVAKAEASEVLVVLEHVHKGRDCAMVAQYVADTSPAPRTGKDGKPFPAASTARLYSMSFGAAMAACKPLCGLCYPPLPPKPQKAEAKASPKTDVSGQGLMGFLMRFRQEDPGAYMRFWEAYLVIIQEDEALNAKFMEAFNSGRHGYETFRHLTDMPYRNECGSHEWHQALNILLGKAEAEGAAPKKGGIAGFLEKEGHETSEAFRALIRHLKAFNGPDEPTEPAPTLSERCAKLEASIQARKDRRRARKEAKAAGGLVKKVVVACLIVVGVSWAVVHHIDARTMRTNSAGNGAASSVPEQKVGSNVR